MLEKKERNNKCFRRSSTVDSVLVCKSEAEAKVLAKERVRRADHTAVTIAKLFPDPELPILLRGHDLEKASASMSAHCSWRKTGFETARVSNDALYRVITYRSLYAFALLAVDIEGSWGTMQAS